MKARISLILIAGFILYGTSCNRKPVSVAPDSFYETELFKAVHQTELFADSKTFVDLTPSADPIEINRIYLESRDAEGFDLAQFVRQHFSDTWVAVPLKATDTTLDMYAHIDQLWSGLTRPADMARPFGSRIELPNPYVVPGGRFREIYYWDSYFTMEGLRVSGRLETVRNMTDNFAFLLDSLGFIPNGTRNYYLTRSQPPFFSLMVRSLEEEDPSSLERYLPLIEKEYAYWMERTKGGNLPADKRTVIWKELVVNRYWDQSDQPRYESYREDVALAASLPKERKPVLYNHLRSAACSGWDFSSRWYAGEGLQTTITAEMIPVDLNCLLYAMESTLSEGYEAMGVEGLDKFLEYQEKADQRRRFIQNELWNPEKGYFFDRNFMEGNLSDSYTLAGVFPLFLEVATPEQAKAVRDVIVQRFLKPGGVVTTLVNSGQQWDAPNGWAPLQWATVKGLLNYGYREEAVDIMQRWLRLNNKVYKATGKMNEKYNVEDLSLETGGGEYPNQDGFGWTNGVALGFKELLQAMGEEVPGLTPVVHAD